MEVSVADGYTMPNWIRPPDVVGDYLSGLQLGQQAASEQQRLQAQQIQAERDHMLEQQRLQISKAYQDQQIQIRQQELKQQQAELNIKTQDAARKIAAQQAYQQWLTSGGPNGQPGDPVTGLLKFGPAMGDVGTGYGQLAREERMKNMVRPPPGIESFDVNGQPTSFLHYTQPTGTEEYRQIQKGTADAQVNKRAAMEVRQMEHQINALQSALDKTDDLTLAALDVPEAQRNPMQKIAAKRYEDAKGRLEALQERVDEYYVTGEIQPPAAAPAEPPAPATAPAAPTAGGVKVISIRPKSAAAPTAPSAPYVRSPMEFGVINPRLPISAPAAAAPPAAAPSVPGPAFLPRVPAAPPPEVSNIPSSPPKPLFESDLTPNTAAYGAAVRSSQEKLRKAFTDLKPVDLVKAAKRLGIQNIAWNPDQGIFFAPSLGGLFSNSINREDLEAKLAQMATEKNLNPLQ
jgi:hypothetical protein